MKIEVEVEHIRSIPPLTGKTTAENAKRNLPSTKTLMCFTAKIVNGATTAVHKMTNNPTTGRWEIVETDSQRPAVDNAVNDRALTKKLPTTGRWEIVEIDRQKQQVELL